MRLQKIIIAGGLLALWAGLGDLWADDEPVWRTEVNYSSLEVVRGVRRTGAAGEAGAELTGEAWRGSIASTVPFDSGEERRATLGAGYRWTVAEEFHVEVTGQRIWSARGLAAEAKHTWTAGVSVTGPTQWGFTPTVIYARDLRRRADFLEGAVARSFPLTRLGAFIDTRLFAGWATGEDWRPDTPGPRRQDSYHYWGAEAYLPYRVGAHTTVIAGLHYTSEAGRSELAGPSGLGKGANLWITFGLTFDF